MNRTVYDPCVYEQSLLQSVSPIAFMLDPIQYQNCNQCRMELGIVGGTAVSHVQGNLVDLESDLRGQTRPLDHCLALKYLPQAPPPMVHLPPCQMFTYGPVPPNPVVKIDRCPGYYY
jgi:hypothetical protein